MIFGNDNRLKKTIPEFLHANKDLLIFICDPKSDNIIVAHKDAIVTGRLKSADGKSIHVVKGVLSHSLFEKNTDLFLSGIAELIKLPMLDKAGNEFYKFIDGALFNISKNLRDRRRAKAKGSVERVQHNKVEAL